MLPLSYELFEAKKYPDVWARTHSIDFSKYDESAYVGLTEALAGLDVGVLGKIPPTPRSENEFDMFCIVNNVGKSHAMPAYFVDTPKDEITDIVAINVNATLRVTYAVLPGMVQRYDLLSSA